MRQGPAFQIIEELVGDYSHVMELSRNPKLFYVETALKTLHSAVDVLSAIEEHNNTKEKKKQKHMIEKNYKELEENRRKHFVDESVQRLDVEYEKVKHALIDAKFQSEEIRAFIKRLEFNLKKTADIFEKTLKKDLPNKAKIEEIMRRTLRDYNRIINFYLEEEK